MAYFLMKDITGCITSGETKTIYDQSFNDASIDMYYKEDHYDGPIVKYYGVVCVFGTKTQSFKFLEDSDRNSFYGSLP